MIDLTTEAEALRRDISDPIASRLMTMAEHTIEDRLRTVASRAWEEGNGASPRTENPYE